VIDENVFSSACWVMLNIGTYICY